MTIDQLIIESNKRIAECRKRIAEIDEKLKELYHEDSSQKKN
jgi:hypothetical protein